MVEEIARYASQDLPEKYADEFYFLLAQLYFNKSVEQELTTGEDAVPPAEGEGEMEFDSNDVGGGGGAGGDAPARVRVPGSAGDDGFDFGLDDLDDGKNKKKGKEKPGVKDGKSKGKPGDVKQPAEEPAKPEEKKDEGGLEFGVDDATKPVPAEEKPKEQPAEAGEKKPAEAAPAPKQRKLVADQKEALEKCVENASKVKETSPLYLKSVFLRGSCLYAMAEFEKSVAAYKDVIKLTKAGKWKNHPLREEAFFTLARVHYEFQQFRAAIFYYNKISRDSPAWLDSLFESSWAYFRLADYEKALGNMVTIQAPFFTEEYFPEALILKAVTYYENCRYPEALGVLGEFEGQYGPLRDELDRLTKDAKTPEDYYALLKTLENSKNATALTKRLSKVARKDQNLSLKAVSARELETEEQKIQKSAGLKDSELQKELLTLVQKRREEVVKSAGAIARAKLEAERDELKSLSSQLFRIKFEVIKREKEGLEASLRGEKQGSKLGGYRYSTAVADTELYWPFDGEYWRDELGTYEYTLSKGCRQ